MSLRGSATSKDIGELIHALAAKLAGFNSTLHQFQLPAVGTGSLKIPAFFGKQVHTWISFRSADHQLKANSVYTGLIEVRF